MIFDSQLNNYLDHEHDEYLVDSDLSQFRDDLALINRDMSALSDGLVTVNQRFYDGLQNVLNRIQSVQTNLSSGMWDSGYFTQPNNTFIFDGGNF